MDLSCDSCWASHWSPIRDLLQDLLTHTVNSSETIKRLTQHIKSKIKGDEHLSADRCMNLFHCLLEMKDQTLYREIQEFVKSELTLSISLLNNRLHASDIRGGAG